VADVVAGPMAAARSPEPVKAGYGMRSRSASRIRRVPVPTQ